MKDKKNISNNYLNLENTYINLPKNMFSYQEPHKVPSPKSVAFNKRLAQYLGLNEEFLQSDEGIEFLCGNGLLKDTTPISQAYAGHQFGYFTMLGDGRAVLLGEFISKDNERFDLQLKGSGVTPYSRGGDGKATLGPMLREYIISEGMYALGIPTTRSLSVVSTGEEILRENLLPGAVLARIAKSHIRVGTFQYAANYGSLDDLKSLADYTLDRHFKGYENAENKYVYLLNEVIKRQAELIAKWQLVGFIHGVMNTDNVSISGETIDYGPCAFMDIYDPDTVFSSIDREGRYSYINQPKIGIWNLARFAETLLPLLDDNKDKSIEIAESSLSSYSKLYSEYFENGMRKKLGIFNEEANDFKIFSVLFGIMKEYNADFTNTFYYLTTDNLNEMDMFNSEDFKKWYTIWQERLSRQSQSKDESKKLMQDNNPVVIPRNHKVEEALSSAVNDNDYSIMQNLLNVLKNPYDYNNINKAYMELPPKTSCKYKTFCGT